jgi:hypothetical protein
MNSQNFIHGIIAIANDTHLFMGDIFHNSLFLGFITGFIVTVLVIGYVLTKNPRHIPIILRYNAIQSFQKIAPRDKNGTYSIAFSDFIRVYTEVRTIFFIAFISFCVMVSTILITTP